MADWQAHPFHESEMEYLPPSTLICSHRDGLFGLILPCTDLNLEGDAVRRDEYSG